MKTPVIIVVIIFLASIILPTVASEENDSKEYNEKIIKGYVEEDARLGWNIYFFEKKFGSKAAIVYLCLLVFVAMCIKKFVWK